MPGRSLTIAGTHDEGQPRPVLHLSGGKLRAALGTLAVAAEAVGGVERFVEALKLKAHVFQERLAGGRAATLALADFDEIVPLMATARRRVGGLVAVHGWPEVQGAIAALLADAEVPGTADERVMRFCRTFPEGRQHRFVRDLAAEVLHNVLPEHYPLMMRWVWDARTNTGVLREIWHDPQAGDDTDGIVIDIADGYETFLVLREELAQFLADQGIFRDMLWYVDVLAAQVYAGYINAQGGAWLKTDFGSESDPLEHTRRILGLDVRRRRGSEAGTIDKSSEQGKRA